MSHVVCRTDASVTIGTGHVMRCLTLASAWRERGATVVFVCREHGGHLCDLIEERGFSVSRLPVAAPGSSWQDDAEQTRGAIEATGARPDWLVVDHYTLDRRWESDLRTSVGRIMVIDDLADRPHDCDLLVDQNLVADMHRRYADKVPPACALLLGPQYALLQPVYAELRDRLPAREGQIRHVLISFGGADRSNVTSRTIAACLNLRRPDIEIDVVVGATDPHAEFIRDQVAPHGHIHLHTNPPTLAPLMAKADFAIGAGGATSWERLCLGLPALVVTQAENQRPIAAELSERGLIRWLGNDDVVDDRTITAALGDLIREGLDAEWSRACSATVDGKGVNRVCAALTVTAVTPMRARHAMPDDEALILDWANDPITRYNSLSSDAIPAPDHRVWLGRHLQDVEGCRFYVIETHDGVPLGQVRFERSEEAWEIHFAVAPVFRGRGLGRRVVETALQKLRADACGAIVFGQVKDGNHPSRRIFESLGFEIQPKAVSDVVVYRLCK